MEDTINQSQTATLPHRSCNLSISLTLFLILFFSYAYFWQYRSWNEGSRLILTIALVERGTVVVDGYEQQTGDLAYREGHFYSLKPPGHAWLAVPVYAAMHLCGVTHPLQSGPIQYWWPDYLLTVLTSGLLTAVTSVLLYVLARDEGCTTCQALLIGGGYGLCSPAWPYATLFCGHQVGAFCAISAIAILRKCRERSNWSCLWTGLAGLLAGWSAVTEYTLVFAAIAIAGYFLVSGCPAKQLWPFLLAASACAFSLMTYHTVAFGNPIKTGYAFVANPEFQNVYTRDNPIGLGWPSMKTAVAILFSGHGLVWYAPLAFLIPIGLFRWIRESKWSWLGLHMLTLGGAFMVNAAHPTWTGGHSTGPRYLQAVSPFFFIAAAAALPMLGRGGTIFATTATMWGYLVAFGCTVTQYGGRLPDIGMPGGDQPIFEAVFPALMEGQLSRNLGNLLLSGSWSDIHNGQWYSLCPLLVVQEIGLAILVWRYRTGR